MCKEGCAGSPFFPGSSLPLCCGESWSFSPLGITSYLVAPVRTILRIWFLGLSAAPSPPHTHTHRHTRICSHTIIIMDTHVHMVSLISKFRKKARSSFAMQTIWSKIGLRPSKFQVLPREGLLFFILELYERFWNDIFPPLFHEIS